MHWIKQSVAVLAVALFCGTASAGVLNPVYANIRSDDGRFFAVRPFYSKAVSSEGQVQDFLWPLYSRKEFKEEKTSRALIFYFTHNFDRQEDSPRKRRWLLPIFFQGRDAQGEGYFALFPLGGTIHEFFGRDRISFVLFPLFARSRINEVQTTSVLWPIYSRTRGDGIRRDRLFPLAGKSVLEGSYDKRFILWPFWTSADYFYPGDSGRTWFLFPLCGRGDLENEKTLWLLPPFFRFTDGARQDRLYCPWPFIQSIRSEWHSKLYVWPLWGTDQYAAGEHRRTFLLWPFCWSSNSRQAHVDKTRRTVLPFFFYEREVLREEHVPEEERAVVSRYWKIWPLMSWQREGDASRFRLLELWPLKNSAPVERNWAPLWTLYKRTDAEGTTRRDLLWFVWQSERTPAEERSEYSLLKGMFSVKTEGDRTRFRLLYFIEFGK